jgi:hypothetical protein
MTDAQTGTAPATLGYPKAVVIACTCANTSPLNLSKTLNDLGVDGVSFQGAVFNSVRKSGYSIAIDSIPDAPATILVAVVEAIQNATV